MCDRIVCRSEKFATIRAVEASVYSRTIAMERVLKGDELEGNEEVSLSKA
ncbi:predicted protein [Sclerotinia sclerotiorum 1980 UF-70]|uniref:Uncharacterized protein n=1 Tax=Sclerotinia sclerotiorum (strain ATCC 18683 / 1980 / Ss-1) TaxID=665079 RepID=A7ELJ8_SCLS1|nr:predicted protein [Sclerotinia sclerotiorum 1980 UF-70]EDO03714.1 predicted protein [Sclerotinia sclerotiorum 1980 UF-70]